MDKSLSNIPKKVWETGMQLVLRCVLHCEHGRPQSLFQKGANLGGFFKGAKPWKSSLKNNKFSDKRPSKTHILKYRGGQVPPFPPPGDAHASVPVKKQFWTIFRPYFSNQIKHIFTKQIKLILLILIQDSRVLIQLYAR